MKKYIMTEQGLREVNPFRSPDGNYDQRSHFHAYEKTVTYTPFPIGTFGQTYLESEIEFVEQYRFGGDWFNGNNPVLPTRTIARLRTPQVSEFERGMVSEIDKHIEIYKWLLGYYDFPERPTDGRPAYWWRSHLREKLKEIGIEIPNPEPYIKQY